MPTQQEKPIIFKSEMIRATLDGRKTQTRRLIKPRDPHKDCAWCYGRGHEYIDCGNELSGYDYRRPCRCCIPKCPYGRKGDLLYCRETWAVHPRFKTILYRADGEEYDDAPGYGIWKPSWKPSIHMPKKYARIWLELTADPIPQRLRDISAMDCIAEGIPRSNAIEVSQRAKEEKIWFQYLINKINGPGTWEKNPWVWKLEFKRIEK